MTIFTKHFSLSNGGKGWTEVKILVGYTRNKEKKQIASLIGFPDIKTNKSGHW